MDRAQWLEERRKGIGSSDAPAVAGINPPGWGGPLDVYLDKLGLLPPRQSEPMKWGLLLETVIAQAYMEETGRAALLPVDSIERHKCYPWMLASLDRITPDNRIVELKTSRTSEGWGPAGSDEIPESYLLQVQHQMAVSGIEVADVAVLIAGSDFRVYTVERSAEVIDRLEAIEADVWRRVVVKDPPPVDWKDPRTPELVQLLHRPREGVAVDLDGTAAWWADWIHQYGQEIKEREEKRERCKAELAALLGEASVGRLPDGREVVRQERTRKAYQCPEAKWVETRIRKARTK